MASETDRAAFLLFCKRWIQKSTRYRTDSLSGAFDRYFTMLVVYNRAYDEAARHLLLNQPPSLHWYNGGMKCKSVKKWVSEVGDRIKATEGIAAFCGTSLEAELNSDSLVQFAIDELITLSKQREFYFFFDRRTAIPRPDLDHLRLNRARGGDVEQLLRVLYQLRCNLFHGHKEFEKRQMRVLRPANKILNMVVRHVVAGVADAI